MEDLHGEAWVQTSRSSPCARHVVRCCHAAGFEPNVAFESDDYQTVQGLVAAGVGVALIPELALSVVRDDIVVRALFPHPPVRQVIAALGSRDPADPSGHGDAADPRRARRALRQSSCESRLKARQLRDSAHRRRRMQRRPVARQRRQQARAISS